MFNVSMPVLYTRRSSSNLVIACSLPTADARFGTLFCPRSTPAMAESLAPECTPLKQEYDSCFNVWFEGYLEPAISPSATDAQRTAHYQRKAKEFEDKCGKVYKEYQSCLQVRFSFPCIGCGDLKI